MDTDGMEIFGIAGMVGIDGALLSQPPTFDETPENTPPAFAALEIEEVKIFIQNNYGKATYFHSHILQAPPSLLEDP